MDDAIEQAVERVIATMRNNLGEQLTVDDMARVAMFSKFHFTRIFQRVTGVSPGRFLSALRLQQAKRLLISTSLNVADISLRVGYNSVGTFSSRFTRSVGLTPTAYRRLGGFTSKITLPDQTGGGAPGGVVSGHVWPGPSTEATPVFVGLFPTRIPEGRPARCTIIDHPGPYLLDQVPDGVWHLVAQSIPATSGEAVGRNVVVATHGPIEVHRTTVITTADVRLEPMRALDPPVLLAVLDGGKAA